ncbi:hypothetical protein ACFFRR_000806 [Megaselia abdita]
MKLPLKKYALVLASIAAGLTAIFYMIWFQIDNEDIPNLIKPSIGLQYDYIIVGAGSAGCVVARFLSEYAPESSVLLIEAGHTFGFISKVPLLAVYLQGSSNDWKFQSTPQKHSSWGMHDKIQFFPRGKGLGGTSQINFLVNYVHVEDDLKRWNLKNWTYEIISPYFDTIENTPEDEIWEVPKRHTTLSKVFDDASYHFRKTKFRRSQYNTKNGLRHSVFQKYLRPAFEFENLKILTNSIVTRLNFNQFNCISSVRVRSHYHGVEFNIAVGKEVIISAGAYQSPQLLMVSGIGSGTTLSKHNIILVSNLPDVGENLHDHLNVPMYTSMESSGSINFNNILSPSEIWKYLKRGEGVLSHFGVYGHVDSPENSIGLSFFGVGAIDENSMRDISNYKKKHFRGLFPLYHNKTQEGFVTITNCVQPQSRGIVLIQSKDFETPPLIDPNYLETEVDLNCSIRAVRFAAQIITSSSFRKLRPKIHWPLIPGCEEFGPFERDFETNKPSYRYLECVIRSIGVASHHPGGTCAIGKVVGEDLNVYGVHGVRVVDASIFPKPISGNPNAMIIAMAKRLVDVILNR